jgi:Ethylbenzene dehydrogenase
MTWRKETGGARCHDRDRLISAIDSTHGEPPMNVLRLTAVAAAVLAAAGCATQTGDVPPNTLVASKVLAAPMLGSADLAWTTAKPLTVNLSGGENFGGKGSTTATLKAVYTSDTLYMLVQYADPTDSLRRGPFQKQADGSWKKLVDPKNTGGDDNVYYEDKWAMLWPIDNSVKGFAQSGCMVACHIGEGKPYGNKYTANAGEIMDMWHMKGSRTGPLGHVDDQYCDDTRYDAQKNPNAGRKSDPGGPEYSNLKVVNGKPEFMNPDGKPGNAGGKYYVVKDKVVAFDDSKFKPGDEVASYQIHPLSGDRADIKLTQSWKDGVHTSVVSRKLVTGSKLDVQFSDLAAQYPFGFAAFDNAQVRHAVHYDPLFLRFAK